MNDGAVEISSSVLRHDVKLLQKDLDTKKLEQVPVSKHASQN